VFIDEDCGITWAAEHLNLVIAGGNVSVVLGREEMTACPYLGLKDDPKSHALYARTDHVCVLSLDQGLDVSWQRRCCLSSAFRQCPQFRAKQQPVMLRPVTIETRRSARSRMAVIAVTVIVLIWLTSAVSATVYVVNRPSSDVPPARLTLPIDAAPKYHLKTLMS
jgi:hypothetical protein